MRESIQKIGVLFVIFLSLISAKITYAQYSFERITKSDGLSHNNVECILEDNQGFMWFGTRNGLCRYDGYEIKIYRHTESLSSISGNRIQSIAEDQQGQLWIGTYQSGLNKFDKKKNSFVHYGDSSGIGNQVYKIKILKDGTVCIGSNNGLAIYNEKLDDFTIFTPKNTEHSINSFLISDILETRDNQIYIASWENDIMRFDRNTKEFFSIAYNPLDRVVVNYRKRLLEDLDGNIWISAQTHGLAKYNPKTGTAKFYHHEKNELNTEILNGDMILSPEGNIWLTTDIGGINIFKPQTGEFEYLTHNEDEKGSLPTDHIYTLYLDKQNRVWVGTFDKGVCYYDPLLNKFKNRSLPENLYSFFRSKSVISLFQDKEGTIWIGTDGQGLHSIDKNNHLESFYLDEKPNSISSNVITSLGQDRSGNILIGTYSGGLSVYNPKTKHFKHFDPDEKDKNSLHSEHVWTMMTDSKGMHWLGLLGNGVDIYDADKGNFLNVGPYSDAFIKIPHPNIMSMLEDADGDIWFGTEGDGIYVYDKQAAKVLRVAVNSMSKSLNKAVIKDLYQDSREQIWIATEGDGLLEYNKATKNLKSYGLKDGLPGMIVLGINEDNSGNLWVSTYDGLAILHKNSSKFSSFYKYDGLSSNEFNAEAFIKLNNGSFLLGSNNGIDLFDPLSIRFNQNLPKVLFTKLSILNQEVLPGDTVNDRVVLDSDICFTKEINLKYSDKIFSIEFAAINTTQARKCQYKYMLQGFDEHWINTDHNRRFASYSNLKDGSYTFLVQASNNDGKWGNNTVELRINVLPPFWKSLWFRSLMGLLVLSILLYGYLSRIRFLNNKFNREKVLNEKRILELEKENIESELEKLTYYTVNRNRVLVNYKTRLNSLSVKAKESVKKGLQLVISEIDKEISDDKEWKYLEPRLDKFYNDFISKLREKHPDLTLSEIKVATYVRMNLTSKEISEFMNKTIRAVENDRYRLRKKINLDSNESLQNYLINL